MESEFAPAKVNLFLHVLGRRADGYHLLDSLAVFPGAADILHAAPADDVTLEIAGPFAGALNDGQAAGDNLVLRAAHALLDASGQTLGARLVLDKRLPVASGIGGGSADAAASLRLLNRIWQLGLPVAELAGIALGLGADVPVCLGSQPSRMGGVGEIIGLAPAMPSAGIVLLNPGVPVSTQDVFRARDTAYSEPATLPAYWADAAAMAATLRDLANDLEAPAIRLCPAVAEALAWLSVQPGCLLARMSGSGATCFGLFTAPDEAARIAQAVPPGWWAWGGSFTH